MTGVDVPGLVSRESWSLTGQGVEPILVGPGGETDWQR